MTKADKFKELKSSRETIKLALMMYVRIAALFVVNRAQIYSVPKAISWKSS